MRKLILSPEQRSYAADEGEGAIRAILDGGAYNYRAQPLGAALVLPLRWACDALEYRYLSAFFRTATRDGSEPFLVDLIVDSGVPTEHVAAFIPGTWALAGVRGTLYQVQASVEARPAAEVA